MLRQYHNPHSLFQLSLLLPRTPSAANHVNNSYVRMSYWTFLSHSSSTTRLCSHWFFFFSESPHARPPVHIGSYSEIRYLPGCSQIEKESSDTKFSQRDQPRVKHCRTRPLSSKVRSLIFEDLAVDAAYVSGIWQFNIETFLPPISWPCRARFLYITRKTPGADTTGEMKSEAEGFEWREIVC